MTEFLIGGKEHHNKRQQMGKKKTARGALLASNLPQLQNLIKRDPEGYRDEFLHQLNHFESIRRIFELHPEDEEHAKRFRELIGFLSQVAPCYPRASNEFPRQISSMLLRDYTVLGRDSRSALVHGLVLLRNKLVTPLELLQTLFPLLPRTTSATLRSFIRKTILTELKAANLKAKNHKMNRAVQAMMFDMVEKGTDVQMQSDNKSIRYRSAGVMTTSTAIEEALWAVTLARELWVCRVWDDAKTVSIIALACFHFSIKVQSAAFHFFLGDEQAEAGEVKDNFEIKNLRRMQSVKKLTPSGEKKLTRVSNASSANFPALEILHDPQGLGEKLYESLLQHDRFFSLGHKILHMEFLGRLMGAHKLCILGFYSYIMRYLTHHQIRVTIILVALAQSVHDLTPPDVLAPIIKKLAKEFVHPGVGSEVIAAGINAICEVCRRQPWCMDEDLLADLIEYRRSNDKGVVVATRGLLQLYRKVNPHILKRRERGKAASLNIQAEAPLLPYGQSENAPQRIEGLDLLDDYLEQQHRALRSRAGSIADDGEWTGWDIHSDVSDSSDSGSWVAVRSEGSELEIDVVGDDDDDGGLTVDTSVPVPVQNVRSTASSPRREDLAITKILTPSDFAILNELRMGASKQAKTQAGSAGKRKAAALEATRLACDVDERTLLSETDILGPRKKAKADYAARIESIQRGREGREKFGSSKGKQRGGTTSSSTNREKARQKPLMMILASKSVRGKKKVSIRDKQKRLRAHIERAKKAGH